MAEETGVDLAGLKGSGPGGRIVKADVESAGASSLPTPAPQVTESETETAKGTTTHQELTRLQQVVSQADVGVEGDRAHFYLQAEIDVRAAVEARSRLKGLTPEGRSCLRSTT